MTMIDFLIRMLILALFVMPLALLTIFEKITLKRRKH
jgi:hypothetical protein